MADAWRWRRLEPIILLDHVKAGDKVLVAVKLLHTADVKRMRERTAHEFPEGARVPKTCARIPFSELLIPSLAPVTVRIEDADSAIHEVNLTLSTSAIKPPLTAEA